MIAVLAAVAAVLFLAPTIRGLIFANSVPAPAQHRDACPHCGHSARSARAWLPVLLPPSGRCRRCGACIGPPPATVELTTVAVLGVLGWRIAAPLPLAAFCWAAVIGVALAYVDLAVHRLPNGLVFTAFAGTLVLLTATAGIGWDVWRLVVAVMCSIGVAALYLLLALLPRGFGLGDVKLGLLVGLAAGWYGPRAAITATVTALILAGFVALALSLRRSAPANIPHGPFMLAGLILSLVTLGS